MTSALRGRVWVFGDDVDTDVMAPWNDMGLPWEERRERVLHTRPGFAAAVSPGDVVVAGRNWGCGSSREQAPDNLRLLGLAAVVAESFGRIYFRNCVATAFPNLACPEVRAAFREGDEIELDLASGAVRNPDSGAVLHGEAWNPDMLAILEAGGLLEVLKRRVAAAGQGA